MIKDKSLYFLIENFRKQLGICIMIITTGIICQILNEFSTDTVEVTKNTGLYCNMSSAVDFYPVQVVKH